MRPSTLPGTHLPPHEKPPSSSQLHSSTEREFDSACKHLMSNEGSLLERIPLETRLKLYGLFKQATLGDYKDNTLTFNPFDVAAKAKRDAWQGQRGLPKDEAMREYVQVVLSVDPQFIHQLVSKWATSTSMSSSRSSFTSTSSVERMRKSSSSLGFLPIRDPQHDLPRTRSEIDTTIRRAWRGDLLEATRESSSLDWEEKDEEDDRVTSPPRGVLRKPTLANDHSKYLSNDDDASNYSTDSQHEDGSSYDNEFGPPRGPSHDVTSYEEIDNRRRKCRAAAHLDDDNDVSEGDSDEETVMGTLFFTLPFVLFYKAYRMISGVLFFPLTSALRLFGIKLKKVPENVTLRERKQTAALFVVSSLLPMTLIIYVWMFFLLIFPLTSLPAVSYIVWMLYYDKAPRDGSRKPILRNASGTKHFVDYFPITLSRKSEPLDPQRRYVFCYHPHGIVGLGAFGAFATEAAGFSEMFPGIDLKLLTLDQNFKIPIMREILLWCGLCSCSRKSCDAILQRRPGSAICLVVGGAAESLESEHGTYRLVLGRKGFIRVAVENDADLVPVLAFGETSLFETFSAEPGTWLREFQKWMQRKLGFTIPIFWGRGMFNTTFGIMPKRRPIHVVTGEPLSAAPFREQGLQGEELIDAVHAAYVAALKRLFDENKDQCEPGVMRKEALKIVQ